MNIKKQVERAKIQLLLNFPFFASQLLKLQTVITENAYGEKINTAATNGIYLFINPEFFAEQTEKAQIGLLAHEVLHPALLHHTRRHNRHPKLWNMACDYAINPILMDANIELPPNGLYDKKYIGMSADAIYDDLVQNVSFINIKIGVDENGNMTGEWQAGDGFEGGFGDVMDFPSQGGGDDQETDENGVPTSKQAIPTHGEITAEEMQKVQDLIAAHQISKMAGKGSSAVEKLINEFLEPKVDWRTQLERIVSEKAHDDYTWTKGNRRHLQRGFYLPILENETYGEIAFMLDTSGSIGQRQLNVFAAECNGINDIAKSKKWAIYCDANIAHVDEFEGLDEIVFKPHGGGGTDFRPPFRWLGNNDVEPKIAIYFTDGYCDNFPNEVPDYPVIWALYGGKRKNDFNPPFGDVIEIPRDVK